MLHRGPRGVLHGNFVRRRPATSIDLEETRLITVSLQEFARTGRFGPIQPGMLRDELKSILGEPDCWGGPNAESTHTADIWKYGDIEFYLWKTDVLYQIHSDDFTGDNETPTGRNRMLVDPWIVRGFMDHRDFEKALRQLAIPHSIERCRFVPTMLNITTDCGACFRFQTELEFPDLERLGLHSFSIGNLQLIRNTARQNGT